VSGTAAEAVLLGLLAGHNWVSNRALSRWGYVPGGLAAGMAAVWLSRRGGATREELGLEAQRMGNGIRVGAIASTLAIGTIGAAVAMPRTRRLFVDERARHPSGAALVYEMAVRIPIGTAVGEELLFRSALLGLSLSRRSWGASVAWSSTLFGLWHVVPTIATLPGSAALAEMSVQRGRGAAVASAVVVTTVGGVVFAELRRRSGSIVAPILLHATLNVVAFAASRWAGASSVTGDDEAGFVGHDDRLRAIAQAELAEEPADV
jgi:membrane protease YdiL (CAAX protease family)